MHTHMTRKKKVFAFCLCCIHELGKTLTLIAPSFKRAVRGGDLLLASWFSTEGQSELNEGGLGAQNQQPVGYRAYLYLPETAGREDAYLRRSLCIANKGHGFSNPLTVARGERNVQREDFALHYKKCRSLPWASFGHSYRIVIKQHGWSITSSHWKNVRKTAHPTNPSISLTVQI